MDKIIILGALSGSLVNFRGELIKAISSMNTCVIGMAAGEDRSVSAQLEHFGARYHPYPVSRRGVNPFMDLKTFLFLRRFFRKEAPSLVFAYTIKPIVWGGLASRASGKTKFYAMVEGVGYAFQGGGWVRDVLKKVATILYRFALLKSQKVIFLNPDNQRQFVDLNIVPEEKTEIVPGIGVDLDRYPYESLPSGPPTFLCIGRLLGEKGFREYVQAAGIVKKQFPDTIFRIVGPFAGASDGISEEEVSQWVAEGLVQYEGETTDVRPYIKSSHIYVLPSYHEGMPRTILEAMATGRPILTTDVPGCRETVVPNKNGLLVAKADPLALAQKMVWFIENRAQWSCMAQESRRLAEDRYDVHKINAKLLKILNLGVV